MKKLILIFAPFLLLIGACNETLPDNQTSGTIAISVDETYKPVMEEQVKIFQSRYPNSKLHVQYKPEADCIKDFINDTTRLIFITRPLSDDEKALCKLKNFPITRELSLVRDGVAFIVAKNAKNNYTQKDFEAILAGAQPNTQIVFDNQNSSTISRVADSILKGKPLCKNTFAAKGSIDLINYVSTNTNAIGAVGYSWLADKTDSTTKSLLSKIDVVGILPTADSLVRYRKPCMAYISNKEYPYIRELYFISKETWVGLGTGFANYLGREGQIVFYKSMLFPTIKNVNLREINAK
jgi:phosphate transport system substrate-binding protein